MSRVTVFSTRGAGSSSVQGYGNGRRFCGGPSVHELLIASALLLVVEGVWPFLSPASFRQVLLTVAGQPDGPLRLSGLVSMLAGVALLYLVN
ncbi:MAG TPA: DUF2065 domain-containing protein [Lamprocystis sp. (in: g-proteobacteria)]|nr:DUF2065 domain-containing protein [Lamprocystis sp. (in: g-proteobacteria)]